MVDPAKYYRNNVAGTISLLDALRGSGVRRIVFSSTCAVYGVPSAIPIREKTPLDPVNPYGASKMMVERILATTTTPMDCPPLLCAISTPPAPIPEGEIGEAHDPETHLIPLALDAALGGHGELTVFGNDYPTPDGTCVRDYIHVTDLGARPCPRPRNPRGKRAAQCIG